MGPGTTFIVADDLTGSADAALPFWRAGRRASVVFEPSTPWPENAEVLSVCTHSRAMTEADAHAAVSEVSRRIPPAVRLYKKIDSTLRGWIGAECRALWAAQPKRHLVFAPAYPTKGRMLGADGIYRVHGTPLAETEFATEIAGLGADSRLPGFVVRHFGELASRVQLVPAETPEQLSAGIEGIAEPALWIGSPGLAMALAGRKSLPVPPPPVPSSVPAAPIIVVAGSRRTLTRQQVNALERAVVPTGACRLQLLRIGESVYAPERALALAEDLGRQAAAAARGLGPCGLILTGGDIAAATCRHLGIHAAEIVGEVEDGMPVLRAGDFHFVTKAGGFGTELSLVRAYARLASFFA